MSDPSPSFSVLLRRLRSAAALSQEALAERAGLSRNAIGELERGLHPAPRLETVRMLADALALTETDRAAMLAAARPDLFQHNGREESQAVRLALPMPLSSLIGREAELAAVRSAMLADEVRLLTLTGPGGVGKTRLAVAVAADVAGAFPDGVAFVDLSPLMDHALVVPTIATTLGVQETAGRLPHETLADVLASRQMLLVLDNCERVLEAAPALAALLAACPGATMLATSREALHLRGERLFPLGPLPLPANPLPPVSALTRIPAIALFLARAMAVQPDFTLTAKNAAAVAAICQRVDGLPLAIELAAARVRHLPPEGLLARLEPRLPLLTGGPRDQPARLRTMRDAIAWSYDLLTSQEQAILRHLAVFVGGFTLEAVEAIVSGSAAPERDVLERIGLLVDKSLLRRVDRAEGEPRFGMLETIGEFAWERLVATGEAPALRDAHAAYFLALTERADPEHPHAEGDPAHAQRLVANHDNLRAALTWLEASGQHERFLRMATSTAWLWNLIGHYHQGIAWLERAIARAGDAAPRDRMRALRRLALLASNVGQSSLAHHAATSSLELARSLGDHAGMGWALISLAVQAASQGDQVRDGLLHQEALACFREAGNRRGLAHTLSNLGDWAYIVKDYERAAAWSAEGLAIARELPETWYTALALNVAGQLALALDDAPTARRSYVESAEVSLAISDTMGVAQALSGLAGVALLTGYPERATRWLAAIRAYCDRIGAATIGNDEQYARTLAGARASLTTSQFDVAWLSGRSLPIDLAIADAISETTETVHGCR